MNYKFKNMKIFVSLALSLILLLGLASCNDKNAKYSEKAESCFSKVNFDIVYKYLDDQIKKGNKTFYEYDSLKLILTDTTEISFKKDFYTLAKINQTQGIVSLAKAKRDNDIVLNETEHMFCEILLLAKKMNY